MSRPAETVLLRKISKYWNQQDRWNRPDGTLVITPHRLFFRSHPPTLSVDVPLDQIEHIELARVWGVVPALRLHLRETVHVFTFLFGARSVLEAIKRARDRAALTPSSTGAARHPWRRT
jgi:hypothetical protein